MRIHRPFAVLLAIAGASPVAAQTPDSATRIRDLTVTVMRTASPLSTLGASVTVIDSTGVRRGRIATGLDEALAFVPGVIAENRWNYSLDQRLSIRGFGARANFGLRGVKILLDGVPQTLPDGQSQLNNVDLSLVNRVEVLRGGASALYGNASGGVVSFTTTAVPSEPWRAEARTELGSFGTSKEQVVFAARSGVVGGTVAASRFNTDGFRQQSAADQRRLSAALDWNADANTVLTLRIGAADDPRARNPGALTAAEVAANRDSAAAANIRRGADKSVTQTQLAVGVRHDAGHLHVDATLFGLTRGLDNPLATPPPAPAAANQGTWVGIDRRLGGGRAAATYAWPRVSITSGIDAQDLRDDRINRRSTAGMPTDTLLVDQREGVSELAGFAQLAWSPDARWTLRGGARHDANQFSVSDHLLSDGDASAARTLAATSGNAGVAFRAGDALTAWTDIATVFETPTTTELANRPDGTGGFNPDLNPQRSVTAELGVRGRRARWTYEVAAYHTATHDAIVAYSEVAGRSYFRNAGRTRTTGAEASVAVTIARDMQLRATWTLTNAVFTEYRVVNPGATDTLDGKRLAGIPRNVVRYGVSGRVGGALWIDIDQAFASSMYADDRNTIRVDGWGPVTGLRLAWRASGAHYAFEPFAGVLNAFDQQYTGSVTINGAGGRVFEPAAGRTIYAGASITAR